LLAALGLQFEIHAADLPEVPQSGETPDQFVARAAREKAVYIAAHHAGERVLGADTIVTLEGEILGKPRDRDHARRMLSDLSGTAHRVCTGVAVAADGRTEVVVVSSEVAFRAMTSAEIEAYIDSGEPFDKAGGYGIQGEGGRFVVSLSGSYSNVIGLPLVETAGLLCRSGER
jgi:septum formation protein